MSAPACRTVLHTAALALAGLLLSSWIAAPDARAQERTEPAASAAVRTVTHVSRSVERIARATKVRKTKHLTKGHTKVLRKGRDGRRVTVTRTVVRAGVVVSRTTRVKVSRPRARVVAKGTAPTTWERLARCESGGNPQTNTGNGYYGLYQFSAATWRSVGGKGLPHQASAAEQTKRAKKLRARSGWGQWPACARQLGLA